MKIKFSNRLARNLLLQMIAVVVIISASFYFITAMQSKQMERSIFDKANLFSAILGAYSDKIIGDNLTAHQKLQEATVLAAEAQSNVEDIKVITTDNIILSSSSSAGIWEPTEDPIRSLSKSVLKEKRSQSVVMTKLGKELVIHITPLFEDPSKKENLIGVLEMTVRFASQQGDGLVALRTNKRAYFRKEAFQISDKISRDLKMFIDEAQRNFSYIEQLIDNILSDRDIVDVHLFSKDLGLVLSDADVEKIAFLNMKEDPFSIKAMESESVIIKDIEGKEGMLQVVSPLYLSKGDGRKVAGSVGIVFSLSSTNALIVEMRKNLIVMGLVIICAFILLIGLFFRRKIFNPVNKLISLTESIKEGDLSQRIDHYSQNEIGQLAEAFNGMLDTLERSQNEIDGLNLQLQKKVEDVTGELEVRQEQLMKSEKLASIGVLSSGIAHEINNPLGVILGHTQMLLKEFKDRGRLENAESAEDLLKNIEKYTKRCSHIVTSLLQFTRKRDLQFAETDVQAALENSLLFTSGRFSQKNIEVVQDYSIELPPIMADVIQLEQVFINLLLNAEQSINQKGGKITVSTNVLDKADDAKSYVVVAVEDTGHGISREHLGKIFDPFFSTKDPGDGVGLGLSVSYGIIKAHKGEIEAISQEGSGTKVIVKLPIRK